jgi:hypothetical protein
LGNRLGDLFDRLRHSPPETWDISESDNTFDYITHIARQIGPGASDIAPLIIDALDNRQAALYVGSVDEITSKTLGACVDTIKALARMRDKTFRIGLMRLGACIIVITASADIGPKLTTSLDVLGKPLVDELIDWLADQLSHDVDEIEGRQTFDTGDDASTLEV